MPAARQRIAEDTVGRHPTTSIDRDQQDPHTRTVCDTVSHNSTVVLSGRGRPPAQIDDAVAAAVLRRLATARSFTVKMQDLADDVGVHRSTLYRRWPTEHALLTLALERTAARLQAELDPADASPRELLTRLAVLLNTPTGRGLVRAQIVLGTTVSRDTPSRQPRGGDAGMQTTLDLLVGAVIHRLFIVGMPCDAEWQQQVLDHLASTDSGRGHRGPTCATEVTGATRARSGSVDPIV
ncbi:TetR/AcrR family transcriptional regulator [uncultured Amnibacterium sp.]|uniref:TetR/AcrR family transcriptional regulator n=1 Tax=uncultured Amnibacterium sp. TaxID=1631851 RepID=UPI0035C9DD98